MKLEKKSEKESEKKTKKCEEKKLKSEEELHGYGKKELLVILTLFTIDD